MPNIILFLDSVKEDVELKRNNANGFTLIEVLIASGIIMMLVSTFLPISSLLQREKSILSDRRKITSNLHDELVTFLYSKEGVTSTFTKTIQNKSVVYQFTFDDKRVKGCVNWINVKKNPEFFCLYGYQEVLVSNTKFIQSTS